MVSSSHSGPMPGDNWLKAQWRRCCPSDWIGKGGGVHRGMPSHGPQVSAAGHPMRPSTASRSALPARFWSRHASEVPSRRVARAERAVVRPVPAQSWVLWSVHLTGQLPDATGRAAFPADASQNDMFGLATVGSRWARPAARLHDLNMSRTAAVRGGLQRAFVDCRWTGGQPSDPLDWSACPPGRAIAFVTLDDGGGRMELHLSRKCTGSIGH